MRSDGLWHPRLAQLVAAAGHGDTIVVADPGLPVRRHVETVDLVWRRDEPRFLPVVEAVHLDLVVESATVADQTPADVVDHLTRLLGDRPLHQVTHDALKRAVADAYVVVRTGETTPYSNVVLHCGVPF